MGIVFILASALFVFLASPAPGAPAGTGSSVTVVAKRAPGNSDAKPGAFVFTRTGTASTADALVVAFDLGGTAKAATDYEALPGTLTIPAGVNSAVLEVKSTQPSTTRTVVLKLRDGATYNPGTPNSATLTVGPPSPALFVATLRPTREATDSTGYGTATLLLAPDATRAQLTVLHSNLTSTLVSSHVKLGAPARTAPTC